MGKTVLFISGKGGTGCTTALAFTAAALAARGNRVLCLDLTGGASSLDILLGLENRVVYTIADVFSGTVPPSRALIRFSDELPLYLLPGSGIRETDEEIVEKTGKYAERLRERFDYILIDLPSGDRKTARKLLPSADRAVLLTAPDTVSLRTAARFLSGLDSDRVSCFCLLITKVRTDLLKKGVGKTPEEIQEMLGIPLLGLIAEESLGTQDGLLLSGGESRAETACANIAARLDGEEVPISLKTGRHPRK